MFTFWGKSYENNSIKKYICFPLESVRPLIAWDPHEQVLVFDFKASQKYLVEKRKLDDMQSHLPPERVISEILSKDTARISG